MDFEMREDASAFTSASQQARIWTEGWVLNQMYCPSCGNEPLTDYPNNAPVADFYCAFCNEDFELKSKNGRVGKTVPDGAYASMMKRLASDNKPSLMLLGYRKTTHLVRDVAVIPKQFFLPELIRKRPPLGPNARRAGWVGCDIKLERVPKLGKIDLVVDSTAIPKDKVLRKWEDTLAFRKHIPDMGWVADVLRCVESIPAEEFTTADAYRFEAELAALHADNNNVRAKIRQQLQVLRDAGVLQFVTRGHYRKL